VAEATARDVAKYGGWPEGVTTEDAIKAHKAKTQRFVRLSRFMAWQSQYEHRHECSLCWEMSHVNFMVFPVSGSIDDLKHAASDAASSADREWIEDIWFEVIDVGGYKVWLEARPLCIKAWGWPS
jgi:hypothetical protein